MEVSSEAALDPELSNYTRRVGAAWTRHYVMYRFGDEEYVRITRL